MAERVVLHVGLMKSGTSFIQQVLRNNRATLREHGVLFPTPWPRQVRAVKDISARGGPRQPRLADDGPWRTLLAEVRAWPGTVVLSMEFLGPRGPAKARHIVEELAPAQVEVLVSVRDLARTVPAMWQERLQNGGIDDWADYAAGVEAEDRTSPGPGRAFWTRQDAPGITEVWQRAAGREHVTVLTVPPPGAPPSLLWERFASVVPLGATGLDLEARSNPSLGLSSLLVLRQLNLRLRERPDPLTPAQYERVVKQLLAKRGLAGRAGEPRLGHELAWVPARGDREIERLRALHPRVVGDLEELRCRPVAGSSPEAVDADQQLAAAVEGLEFVVHRLAQRPGARRRA